MIFTTILISILFFQLKLGFLKPSTLYPIFFKPAFFLCDFFLICFHRSPPQILLETKRFASINPETFIKKFFRKISKKFLNFLFEKFSVEKDGFFAVSSWGRIYFVGFRDLCVSLCVFFGAVKLMK